MYLVGQRVVENLKVRWELLDPWEKRYSENVIELINGDAKWYSDRKILVVLNAKKKNPVRRPTAASVDAIINLSAEVDRKTNELAEAKKLYAKAVKAAYDTAEPVPFEELKAMVEESE